MPPLNSPKWRDAAELPAHYLRAPRRCHGGVALDGALVNADLVLRLASDLLWTGLLVSLPVLGLTMAVGLAVSVVQVVTQLQEVSISVVPKLLAAAAALMVFGPWMLRMLCQFTIQLWSRIPNLA